MTQLSRIQHTEAWRCIAVSMVLRHHLTSYSHPWYRDHRWHPIFARSWKFGHLGVLIFVCISGYVICRGLMREQADSGRVDAKAFYLRRFFRIVPLLGIHMLAILVSSLSGAVDVEPSQFTRAGLFACNLDRSCRWYLASAASS